MQRRDALQTQYDTAERNKKYSECVKLGKALAAADVESGTLALSIEDYKTLYSRHKVAVSGLTALCDELLQSKDLAALEPLSQLLDSLLALDTAELMVPTKPVYITDGREGIPVYTLRVLYFLFIYIRVNTYLCKARQCYSD